MLAWNFSWKCIVSLRKLLLSWNGSSGWWVEGGSLPRRLINPAVRAFSWGHGRSVFKFLPCLISTRVLNLDLTHWRQACWPQICLTCHSSILWLLLNKGILIYTISYNKVRNTYLYKLFRTGPSGEIRRDICSFYWSCGWLFRVRRCEWPFSYCY